MSLLKEFINPIYLDKSNITASLHDFVKNNGDGVNILTLQNFIKPEIYQYYYEILQKKEKIIVEENKKSGRQSRSIIVESNELNKFYKFFESKEFAKYLSIYFGQPVQKDFYVDENEIKQEIGTVENSLVAEMYQKGDYLDWHIDKNGTEVVGNFIYYLDFQNHELNEETGGYFETGNAINKKGRDGFFDNVVVNRKIFLQQNSLSLLKIGDESFHRVVELKKDINRLTINGSMIRHK